MFRKILVANDGSPGAFAALQGAIDLAVTYGAELRFAPVVERSRQLAAARGLSLQPHLVPGHPVSTIVEFVRTHDYDLLVVGFMGHSALYNRLIGSTTDRLVDHAPCAVLVVK